MMNLSLAQVKKFGSEIHASGNVGQGSTLKIARGLNALWNKGGLQIAPSER